MEIANQHPDLEYMATYSRDAKKAESFSAKHGSKQIYTDLNALANASEVDAVYIASPNALHYTQALCLLEGGKHILLEKPFCSNVSQAKHLFDIAKKKGLALLEAMRPIHDVGFASLKKELGNIGPIRKCYLNYSKYSSKYDDYKAGKRMNIFDPNCSAGAIMDIGVYPVAFMIALFGKPMSVISQSIHLDSGVDGATSAIASYDGFYCVIDSSKISTSTVPCAIEGENGSVYLPYIRDVEKFCIQYKDKCERTIQREACSNTFLYEVNAFVEMVKHGTDFETYRDITIATMAVLDEIRKQNGIHFPDDERELKIR